MSESNSCAIRSTKPGEAASTGVGVRGIEEEAGGGRGGAGGTGTGLSAALAIDAIELGGSEEGVIACSIFIAFDDEDGLTRWRILFLFSTIDWGAGCEVLWISLVVGHCFALCDSGSGRSDGGIDANCCVRRCCLSESESRVLDSGCCGWLQLLLTDFINESNHSSCCGIDICSCCCIIGSDDCSSGDCCGGICGSDCSISSCAL